MKYIKTLLLFFVLLMSCSKEFETEKELIPEEAILSSCVDYSLADEDNLLTYWNLFVADVKCSRGGPDYGALNTTVNISFITPSAEEFASGITPDHAGYSTFYGYCNSDVVNIGVIKDYWEDYTEIQKLWLMYHEFGHDVYKYEHSSLPTDIMYPSVSRSDITMNDFIKAKEKLLKRDFEGIKYIYCPE
ncbi:hypothetical protein OAB12_01350 [Flavobacteriaceae bacterium]|nr:hypothetical protein [Flavobacteriaceae bacterium]